MLRSRAVAAPARWASLASGTATRQGLAVGPQAARAQLAADFHQIAGRAQHPALARRGPRHGPSRSRTGPGRCRLPARRRGVQVQLHASPAAARGPLRRRRARGGSKRAGAGRSPGVDQRADEGGVAGAAAFFGQRQRVRQHVPEAGGQRAPAGAGAVVAGDVAVVFPGAHLGHHLVQRGLDGLARGGFGAASGSASRADRWCPWWRPPARRPWWLAARAGQRRPRAPRAWAPPGRVGRGRGHGGLGLPAGSGLEHFEGAGVGQAALAACGTLTLASSMPASTQYRPGCGH